MVTSSNDVIDYCPYELAAKQLKELMEESLKAKAKQVNAFSKFSTKEFSDKEWNNYCDEPSGQITPGDENLEQNESQVDYHVESNSMLYVERTQRSFEHDTMQMKSVKPNNSMRLMLTDFPDLNSENDESDSFKDFLRLEEEILKGSPSPNSVRSDRKSSMGYSRSNSDIQIKENTTAW